MAARTSGATSAASSASRLSFNRVGAARSAGPQRPGWTINSVLPSGISDISSTSSTVRKRPVIWNPAKWSVVRHPCRARTRWKRRRNSPQNRQLGSAFALMYRLRLRSCKLLGAFVISPLPPMLSVPVQNSRVPSLRGHYSASPLLRTHPPPSRRSPISRFRRLYGSLLRRFRGGARRASPVARCLLVIVLPLPPSQRVPPLQSVATFHAAFALPTGARPLR